MLYPPDEHNIYYEMYHHWTVSQRLSKEVSFEQLVGYIAWERNYEMIWKCPGHDRHRDCSWKKPRVYAVFVDNEFVPSAYSDFYCPSCAEKVIEKYKRYCAVCGKRFGERHMDSNHELCPDCRLGDLAFEEKRLKANLNRAIEAETQATLTLSEWLDTLDYFDWKCAYCGGEYYLMEHFVPISEGGGTTKDNCVPACSACNCQKAPNSCMPERKLAPVAEYLRPCVL